MKLRCWAVISWARERERERDTGHGTGKKDTPHGWTDDGWPVANSSVESSKDARSPEYVAAAADTHYHGLAACRPAAAALCLWPAGIAVEVPPPDLAYAGDRVLL